VRHGGRVNILLICGAMSDISTQCVIAGGGPAGLMYGYLLARQGVDVVVLEKHADFLRDFRGDTVHPSTLGLFNDLGLLEAFLQRPHEKTRSVSIKLSGKDYRVADFGRLKTPAKYIAMMPQWDFLDFIADEARKLPNFKLMMSTRATSLIDENERIAGLQARSGTDVFNIRAALSIAADGRGSILRDKSGLSVLDVGAPIDVFWMRLPRTEVAADESLGRANRHGFLVLINRGGYWQAALPFAKGGAEIIREQGITAFRERIVRIAPMLADRVGAVKSWDDAKLLTVQVNRLETWWRDGLLFIGDAAHAMSPLGGVGINLAIQDAAAAARILGPSLLVGAVPGKMLAKVQKRREWPAKMTQKAQVLGHERVLVPILTTDAPLKAPWPLKLLNRFGFLRGFPARAIGIGLRPEHWPEGL